LNNSYQPLMALPSVPTRRSSDLEGYQLESDTDTEVVAHLVDWYRQTSDDLFIAVRKTIAQLQGAYALAVVSLDDPKTLVAARHRSEEHTSELQSRFDLVCRLLLE